MTTKEISIKKYILIWMALSLTCYYATTTIMEGSIFNPFYEWINNQYLSAKDSGTFTELFWKKITILFSCFHCLGTWTGFAIGTTFTFLFGIQMRYIIAPTPEKFQNWLEKDAEPRFLHRSINRILFMIRNPIFTICLIVATGFCTSAGSLGFYSVFNYPKHKLELIRKQNNDLLEMQTMYLEEMIQKKCK